MRALLRTTKATPRAAVPVFAAARALSFPAQDDAAGSGTGADIRGVAEEEALDDEPYDGRYDTDSCEGLGD